MDISDLIATLAKLQIEHDNIIQQLANRASATATAIQYKDKKPNAQEADTKIRRGDHVIH